MATSGSIDFNLNARGLCTYALKLIRVVASEETPSASDLEDAQTTLNLLQKSWQIEGPHLSRQTFGSVALVNATASYALSPQPYRIIEARYRDTSGRDVPMIQLSRQEYIDLPLKSASGVPTQYYYDVQRDATTFYTWPVLATATTETIQYTFQRIFEDIDTLDDDLDIPQEWFETVAYCLADRMQPLFGTSFPQVTQRAEVLLADAKDGEREDFITLVPEYRY